MYNQHTAKQRYNEGKTAKSIFNALDASVWANAIHGLTATILTGLLPVDTLDDPEIEVMKITEIRLKN